MANTKRKDKSRKVLRKGESQRPDGTYQFRWTDENRKRHCIYARNLDDLRYKEANDEELEKIFAELEVKNLTNKIVKKSENKPKTDNTKISNNVK